MLSPSPKHEVGTVIAIESRGSLSASLIPVRPALSSAAHIRKLCSAVLTSTHAVDALNLRHQPSPIRPFRQLPKPNHPQIWLLLRWFSASARSVTRLSVFSQQHPGPAQTHRSRFERYDAHTQEDHVLLTVGLKYRLSLSARPARVLSRSTAALSSWLSLPFSAPRYDFSRYKAISSEREIQPHSRGSM